jgi:hypothetical protein
MFLSSVNRSESLADDAKARRWLGRVRFGRIQSLDAGEVVGVDRPVAINRSRLEQISEISDFVMRLQSWLDPEKRAVVFVCDDVQEAVGTLADVANPLVKIRQ